MWRAFRRSEKDECSKAGVLLSGYMDRRLNPDETALVEGHLQTCSRCREELESLRATVALLRGLPEVAPSRSFAVAPARPIPGRVALPALRFATAGVVLLLVLAFAADQTNVLERKGQIGSYSGMASESGDDEAYWLVSGVRNSVEPKTETPVELVVPDHTDNVHAAVTSLATGGVVYGAMESGLDEVPQLVLTEAESDAVARGELTQFTLVSGSGDTEKRFATNDAAVPSAAFDSVMKDQVGPYLNILSSDNSVLYSFQVDEARKEVRTARENAWLRPLEYSLIGLAVVLGGAAVVLWVRHRRARVVEVSRN